MVERLLFLQTSATNALSVSLILLTRRAGYLLLSSINHSSPGTKNRNFQQKWTSSKVCAGWMCPCYISTGAVAPPLSRRFLYQTGACILKCLIVCWSTLKRVAPWRPPGSIHHIRVYGRHRRCSPARNLGDPARPLNGPACTPCCIPNRG